MTGPTVGVNHSKTYGMLTVAQRNALLKKLNISGGIAAQKQPTHNQAKVPHYWVNRSGETCPAYGCIQVTGTEEIGSQNYLQGKKPADGNGTAGWYVFNGACHVPDGEFGMAHDGVLVRSLADNAPSAGDLVSPQANSWYVTDGSLFPVAGPDDVKDDCYKIFVTGGGGGCELMTFAIDEVYGTETAASDHCDDQLNDAAAKYKVSCVKACCGGSPSGAEPDGSYIVHDLFSMFQGGIGGAREEADLIGKEGLAIRFSDCEGYDECKWYVLFINWFRTIQVITNVIMTDTELKFEMKNVEVWDDCDLDPIIIELTDCEDDYYSG